MSAVHGVWPWVRFSGIVARYDVDSGIQDTSNLVWIHYWNFVFPGYRLILALRSKLVVELNRNDVYRGIEGPTNNLDHRVIVRCPVDLGFVQE